jgi:sulfatase maturation enzyme AslB (radical SAM superfamily)
MQCPRINHFVRLNPDGKVSRCGHMVNPPRFDSLEEMNASQWQQSIKDKFDIDEFPAECIRCAETERMNQSSIRMNDIRYQELQTKSDYLIVGGVLDNVCNSACQTCNPNCSTKIGSLYDKEYTIVDNSNKFWSLPLDRITHLDINGGEPSASKNYRNVLANLPPNVQSIRINTNCSSVIPELEQLVARGVKVTVTVSFDGVRDYHDYLRWPIKWDKFYSNLMTYKEMNLHELNLWTTVSVLNICNLLEIESFVKEHNFKHSYALLHSPEVLSIKNVNGLTQRAIDKLGDHIISQFVAVDKSNIMELEQYISMQDRLRGIDIAQDYPRVYYGE